MKKTFLVTACAAAILFGAAAGWAADDRVLVAMPKPMQEHMLASMRDHLQVLNDILADVAAERYDDAAQVAEERLGMSSFGLHEAGHMAAYMPTGMQEAGGALHHAASRFAIAAKDMDVDRSYEGVKKLTAAIGDMTAACTLCHSGYRIR